MQFNTGTNTELKEEFKNEFSPREFLGRYLRYFPWLLLSVAICLGIAYANLRYSVNVYRVTGKLIVKKQSGTFSEDKFENLFMAEGEANLKDEIEQIRSTSVTRRVAENYDLQTEYLNKGKIKSSSVHKDEMPFHVKVVSLVDSSKSLKFLVYLFDDGFSLSENSPKIQYGRQFRVGDATLIVNRTSLPFSGFASNIFEVIWSPLDDVCKKLVEALDVSVIAEYSNVLSIKYDNENIRIGKEVVDGTMNAYQNANLEDKKQIAVNALDFIEEQLDTLRLELSGVEKRLQNYRETNKVIDVEQQSAFYFNNMGEMQTQITTLEVKKRVVEALLRYLVEGENEDKTVPASLGIPEPALIQLITEYNRTQLERELILKGTTAENPVVKALETAVAKLRKDILESLQNISKSYTVSLSDLNDRSSLNSKDISSIPGKQKQLIEITRQQKILEELYSLLLQKKLETSISSASTIYNSRIVEPADSDGRPVKPNKKMTYTIAFLIGLVVPILFIFFKELFNDKVTSKSDVERFTKVPVLGEIGHADISSALIMTSTNRSHIAEQFRALRSNLQFIIPRDQKPIILVTSSFSGEGKSFVSTNLGAAIAITGKRTIILEFDIRKPKILKGLGMEESKGITSFIVGNESLELLCKPVVSTENLFVLPCGPIPPNPSELLLDERVNEIFKYAKVNFDAVIIDSAPVAMVSDAVTLGSYSNACLYLVRHNYTIKKQVRFIEEIYNQGKLPKVSIVINDIAAGVWWILRLWL